MGFALVSMTALAASAQSAAALDKKARDAFAREDFSAAGDAFEEAYRLEPHPATKYNAALAWEKAKDLPRAADAYEAALGASGLDDERAEAARSRLTALKPQLAYVTVSAPIGGTVSVEHVVEAPIPVRFHLSPGEHTIEIRRASGRVTTQSLSLKAGTSTPLSQGDSDGAAPLDAARASQSPAVHPGPPPSRAEKSCSSCTWGWVSIGAGAVAAGASVYFGLRTLSARDDFEASNRTDADAHDDAVSSRTLTNVALGVAAVGVGVGVVLLLSSPSSEAPATRVQLRVGPGGATGSLHF